MIRVTIDIIRASNGRIERMGEMLIANDGTGTHDTGNYDVRVLRKGAWGLGWTDKTSVTRTGRVEHYPRLSYNVWRLISRALRSAFPEEK